VFLHGIYFCTLYLIGCRPSWVIDHDDVPLVRFRDEVSQRYLEQKENFVAQEHCEIQLVRFYLENSMILPVMP
jgi:hypothetical protein